MNCHTVIAAAMASNLCSIMPKLGFCKCPAAAAATDDDDNAASTAKTNVDC